VTVDEVNLKLALLSRCLRHGMSYYDRRSELRSAGVEGGSALWACVPLRTALVLAFPPVCFPRKVGVVASMYES
jgi:hypothetical protein